MITMVTCFAYLFFRFLARLFKIRNVNYSLAFQIFFLIFVLVISLFSYIQQQYKIAEVWEIY